MDVGEAVFVGVWVRCFGCEWLQAAEGRNMSNGFASISEAMFYMFYHVWLGFISFYIICMFTFVMLDCLIVPFCAIRVTLNAKFYSDTGKNTLTRTQARATET